MPNTDHLRESVAGNSSELKKNNLWATNSNSHWHSSAIYAITCNSEMAPGSFFQKTTTRRPATTIIRLWKWAGGEKETQGTREGGGREERPRARCNKKQLTCPLKILNFLTACDHILCRACAVFIVTGYGLFRDAVHPGLFICFYHSTRLCNSNTIVAYILEQILLFVSHRNASKPQQGNLLRVLATLAVRGLRGRKKKEKRLPPWFLK